MTHPHRNTSLSRAYLRQLMQPMTLIVLGRLSSSSSFSIFFPLPHTGKLLTRLTSRHWFAQPHSSQKISLGWMRLEEKVILIFRPFLSELQLVLNSQFLQTSFMVVTMGDSVIWMILPVEISLMESRGMPSVRQQVEVMLLIGQLSCDSLWGLNTLMLSMLFLTKNTLSISTQQFQSDLRNPGELSLAFFMMMLELSNMHPWKRREEFFLSSTEDPLAVLGLLKILSAFAVPLLCTESLRIFFFSVVVHQRYPSSGLARGMVLMLRQLDFKSLLLFLLLVLFQQRDDPPKSGQRPPIFIYYNFQSPAAVAGHLRILCPSMGQPGPDRPP